MPDINREEIIKIITEEVLRSLDHSEDYSGYSENPNNGCVLVIGNPASLGSHMRNDMQYVCTKDYEKYKDILRYETVFIEKLTLNQMVDLAVGRASDTECAAVVDALLNDVDVCLLETALPHRKHKGKIKNPFYQELEKDVKKLQMYGIKLITTTHLQTVNSTWQEKNMYKKPQANVVTESVALTMIPGCEGGEVTIPADAILTPSAKDVFQKANIRLIRE